MSYLLETLGVTLASPLLSALTLNKAAVVRRTTALQAVFDSLGDAGVSVGCSVQPWLAVRQLLTAMAASSHWAGAVRVVVERSMRGVSASLETLLSRVAALPTSYEEVDLLNSRGPFQPVFTAMGAVAVIGGAVATLGLGVTVTHRRSRDVFVVTKRDVETGTVACLADGGGGGDGVVSHPHHDLELASQFADGSIAALLADTAAGVIPAVVRVALSAKFDLAAWQGDISTSAVPSFAKLLCHMVRVAAMRSLVGLLSSPGAVEAFAAVPEALPQLVAIAEQGNHVDSTSSLEDKAQLTVTCGVGCGFVVFMA